MSATLLNLEGQHEGLTVCGPSCYELANRPQKLGRNTASGMISAALSLGNPGIFFVVLTDLQMEI